MEPIEYWKLCTEFTVVEAALLIAGLNPEDYQDNLGHREMKAWSQGLGHESVQTSLGSYGTLSTHEQADVMEAISRRAHHPTQDLEAALATIQAAIARSRAA